MFIESALHSDPDSYADQPTKRALKNACKEAAGSYDSSSVLNFRKERAFRDGREVNQANRRTVRISSKTFTRHQPPRAMGSDSRRR